MKAILGFTALSMLTALISCGQTPDSPTPQTQEPNITPQVVGGVESKPHSHPYATLVGVPVTDKDTGKKRLAWCGGVLISKEWVMTVAHCVKRWEANEFVVRVGVHDRNAEPPQGEQLSVSKRIFHPKIDPSAPWNTGHDIGLLKLSKPVSDPNAKPIDLPSDRIESILNQHKARAIVTGWGITIYDMNAPGSPVLREANVPISPNATCRHPIDNEPLHKPANTICSFPENDKSSCRGDSGSPIVQSYQGKTYVLGMPSFGHFCDGYNVSTRINSYLSWIKQHTGIDGEQQDKANKPIFIGSHYNSGYSLQKSTTQSFSERKQAKTLPANTKTILIRATNLGPNADKAIFRMIVSTENNKKACAVTIRGDSKTFCRINANEAKSIKIKYTRYSKTHNTIATSYLSETK